MEALGEVVFAAAVGVMPARGQEQCFRHLSPAMMKRAQPTRNIAKCTPRREGKAPELDAGAGGGEELLERLDRGLPQDGCDAGCRQVMLMLFCLWQVLTSWSEWRGKHVLPHIPSTPKLPCPAQPPIGVQLRSNPFFHFLCPEPPA